MSGSSGVVAAAVASENSAAPTLPELLPAGDVAARQDVAPARFAYAIHEAGHATMSVLLGVPVAALSIERQDAEGVGGKCWFGDDPAPSVDGLAGSVLLCDWEARRWLERRLLLTLSGPVAEALYSPPVADKHRALADWREAERLVAARQELPGPARKLLDDQDDDATPTDAEQAFRLARICSSGPDYALSFLVWFRQETQAIVASRRFRIPLGRLTLALLEHGELDGAHVHALAEDKE